MKLIIIVVLLLLTGCGAFDRFTSSITGNASKVCMGGVLYYQFTSGTALAVDKDGKPLECK